MANSGLSINLRDEVTPANERVLDALGRRDVRTVMGRAVVGVLKAHFVELDASRHRSSVGVHYYGMASRSVQQPNIAEDGFTVGIAQAGIAQRYYGGTITAGSSGSGKKFLTIPAVPQAMGRRASEFTNLRFIFFPKLDYGALVEAKPGAVTYKGSPRAKKVRSLRTVPREDGRPQVVFWLKRSVTQKADPSVIPEEEKMTAPALAAAGDYLQREWERKEGAAP